VVDDQRERETLAGFCPWATLLLLDAKPKTTRGRDLRIPGLQRKIPSRSSPPSWSVCKNNKRERER
jgi:hypothetical protein